jgi:ribosomal protein S14
MRQELQWKAVDNWKRVYFLKFELYRVLLISIKKNTNIPLIYKQYIFFKLIQLKQHTFLTKHVNRCLKTGRTWGVIKKFQYSRFTIRDEGYLGNLPGFRRFSW